MGRFKTLDERQRKIMAKKGKFKTIKELPKPVENVSLGSTKIEETK